MIKVVLECSRIRGELQHAAAAVLKAGYPA